MNRIETKHSKIDIDKYWYIFSYFFQEFSSVINLIFYKLQSAKRN